MANGLTFNRGIPTDVDVRKLEERFGVPAPGDMIGYDDITDTLKVGRDQNRWRSVVVAWRKKLDREHNILLKAVSNEGFRAMDGHARVDFSGRTYKGGLRRIVKAATIAARTDSAGLTPGELKTRDFIQNAGAVIRGAAATAARQLTYPDPEKAVANG